MIMNVKRVMFNVPACGCGKSISVEKFLIEIMKGTKMIVVRQRDIRSNNLGKKQKNIYYYDNPELLKGGGSDA